MTLATNPQLRKRAGVAVVPPPPPSETKPAFAETKSETSLPNIVSSTPLPPIAPPPNPAPVAPVVKPPEGGGDAYDPSEFNRQAHPERDTSPKP